MSYHSVVEFEAGSRDHEFEDCLGNFATYCFIQVRGQTRNI
jgi:hypothetical protein